VALVPAAEPSRMWSALQDPRHVEFYWKLHLRAGEPKEDWLPMARAIAYLQSQS